jgi:hypothetical protein
MTETIDFTDIDLSPFTDETGGLDIEELEKYLKFKRIMFMGLSCVYDDIRYDENSFEVVIRIYIDCVEYKISRSGTLANSCQ